MTTPDVGPVGRSRICFFVESAAGLKAYLEIAGDDIQPKEGESAADAMLRQFAETAQGLTSKGFKHDTSMDRPAFMGGGGGGNRRNQNPPPPSDIPVPEHDGKPMVYRGAGPPGDDGKPRWGASYNCALDKECTDITKEGKQYARRIYEDAYRKQLERQQKAATTKATAAPTAPQASAPPNTPLEGSEAAPAAPTAPKPASQGVLSSFWITTKRLGYDNDAVHKIAGVETVAGFTRADLASLLERIRGLAAGKAYVIPWQRPEGGS